MNTKRIIGLMLMATMLSGVFSLSVLALDYRTTGAMKIENDSGNEKREQYRLESEKIVEMRKKSELKVNPIEKHFLIKILWGDLKNRVGQEVKKTDWSGSLEVSNAKLFPAETILFEVGDQLLKNESSTSKLAWKSNIYSHYDGLTFRVLVKNDVDLKDVSLKFTNMTASNLELNLKELLGFPKETVVEGNYGFFVSAQEGVNFRDNMLVNNPQILKIKWGDIDNNKENDEPKIKYDGALTANGAKLHIIQTPMFEDNDKVLNDKGSEINWESHINGHFDALLVKVLPATQDVGIDMDATKTRSLTLTLNGFSKTFTKNEQFGRFDLGDGYQVEISNQFQLLDGLKQKDIDSGFERKSDFLQKAGEVEKKIDELKRANKFVNKRITDLEKIQEKFEKYNFDDSTYSEVLNELKKIKETLGNNELTDFQLREAVFGLTARFQQLKEKAAKMKFNQGLIPFRDTDDDQWFTEHVNFVKLKNVVSGYVDQNGNSLGEYRPANNVTVAEMLKIALRGAGFDEKKVSGEAKNERARNMWVNLFYKQAEELGLTITLDAEVDPFRSITRAEVVRLILEIYGVDPKADVVMDFVDVSANHPHARFIQYAKEVGIVSGHGETGKFNPDEPVNRAEVAKIIRLAIEFFGKNSL